MTRLVLSLLGPFDAAIDGQGFLRSRLGKSHGLLAYLAVESGKAHRRTALADLLWPDQPSDRGRHRLRQMLLDIQKELRGREGVPLMLSLDKETVRFLAESAWLDVTEFSAVCACTPAPERCPGCLNEMESRIALYRGEFMAGLSLPDCPDFEDWLLLQRESLHRRALALLELLSTCHEKAGNLSSALKFALRHIELAPWDEFAHRRCMQLYALNGQSSAALHQYERCRHLLETELGALPSKETQLLAERIRNGEFRREPVPSPPQAVLSSPMERRQVTVLYCELRLVSALELDDAIALLNGPQARCMEVIRQFSGHIVQTYGGGLLAYFGYPQPDEHAARHAVQAGLAVVGMSTADIGIRVGVHTGLIITGGNTGLPDIVGETSMIAIQLREHAASAEVAISAETHGLVAGYFDCASLGRQPLPGKAALVETHRVIRESGARTRLDAAPCLTVFTGRETEIERLEALWVRAARGRRQLVLLRGEAGMGKSRLLHMLKARLTDHSHAIRELLCFPEFSQSPFHPLIAAMERIAGFAPGDSEALKFAKLAQRVEALAPKLADHAVPVLAVLLSLPVAAPYRPCEATPEQWKQDATNTLIALLYALAAQHPVLLVIEDLHWIDPSTLELLTLFVRDNRKAPILAVFTTRPGFDPSWGDALDWTLDLPPLPRAEAESMAAAIDAKLPADALAQISERADGIPLFIEELAKIAATDHGRAGIPATLNDLLAVRLNMLGEAKPIAQIAAAIGREFDLGLLRKVSELNAEALNCALGTLEDSGLVLPLSGTARQFKHALVQEAAYQSQTRPDRQAVHSRIAQAMEDDAHIAATMPEVLAQHWSTAGQAARAVHYWLLAGRHAADRFAHQEAVSYYQAGEGQLPGLSTGPDKDRLEFDLIVSWAKSEQMAFGYGGARSNELLQRAATLLERGIGHAEDVFHLLWGRWEGSGASVGHREGARIAEDLLAIAKQSNDRHLLQQSHYALGVSHFWMGELAIARSHLERSAQLEDTGTRPTRNYYGQVVLVGAKSYLSWITWLQGETEQSAELIAEALTLAQQYQDLNSLAYALTFAATLQRWQGNVSETLRLAEAGRKTAAECSNHVFNNVLIATSGWAQVVQGDPAAIAAIQQSIDIIRKAYGSATVALLALLADALAHLGRYDDALANITEALELSKAKDDFHFLAELHRLQGMCLLQQSRGDAARECFATAIVTSRDQGARAFEHKAKANWRRCGQLLGTPSTG